MVKYSCDRCGKEVIGSKMLVSVDVVLYYTLSRHYDICSLCNSALERFMVVQK